MSKITFVYMRKKYQKNIDTNSLLSDEIKKFSSTLNLSLDNLYCIYLGKSLNINTGKKISDYTKKNILIKNCCNYHKLQNLSISLFINLQTNMKGKDNYCFHCKNNLNYYNYFYICSCNNSICPLCIDEHNKKNKNHYQIINNKKFLICEKHNIIFNSFCNKCNKNLCNKCVDEHMEHNKNIISLKSIIPNSKLIIDIKSDINIFKNNLDKFKEDLYKIKKNLLN